MTTSILFFKKHSKTLAIFASGQLLVQLLNLIAGFLMIRWMLKDEFARFTLAFSVQNTFGILVEMGLSSALLAFIGGKVDDRKHISEYFNAVMHLRKKLFLIVIPVSLIAFVYLTYGKGWDNTTLLLLYIAIPFAIYFQGFASFYTVILQLKKEVKKVYRVQVVLAVSKIVVLLLIFWMNILYSWTYLFLNTLLIMFSAMLFSFQVKDLIDVTERTITSVKSVINYIKPTILGFTFSAIQSQVAILFISIFGSESEIADMGALGRLSQLFFFLTAFNSVILQPWFARMPHHQVLNRTLFAFSILSLFLLGLTLISFAYPIVFVKLLGENYNNLNDEFGWIVLISSIGYLAGVLNSIGSARKWIYWWPNVAYIVIFIATILLGILFFNLSEIRGVLNYTLLFTLLNFCMLVVYFTYGLRADKKKYDVQL